MGVDEDGYLAFGWKVALRVIISEQSLRRSR